MIATNFTFPLQLVLRLMISEAHLRGGSILDQDMSAQLPNRDVVLPLDYYAFPEIGVAYKYYEDVRTTWDMANKTCVEHNSTLAVIDSWTKVRNVQSIRQNQRYCAFMGIRRSSSDSKWITINGDDAPISAIPWEPSTIGNDIQYNCLGLWNDGRGVYGESCERECDFVCEIRLP